MSQNSTNPRDVGRTVTSDFDVSDLNAEDEEVVEHVHPDGQLRTGEWTAPPLDGPPPAIASPAPSPRSSPARPVVITQTRNAGKPAEPVETAPPPTPKPKPKPKKRGSLAERAMRPKSAKEALQQERVKAKEAEAAHAPPAPAEIIQMACASLGEIQVRRILVLDDRKSLAERWLAHRARGVVRDDLPLAVTAEVIMDAAARVPRGRFFGAEIEYEGRLYAAIVDGDRVVLLALLEGPSVYLTT